jgi:hypothetical protein
MGLNPHAGGCFPTRQSVSAVLYFTTPFHFLVDFPRRPRFTGCEPLPAQLQLFLNNANAGKEKYQG